MLRHELNYGLVNAIWWQEIPFRFICHRITILKCLHFMRTAHLSWLNLCIHLPAYSARLRRKNDDVNALRCFARKLSLRSVWSLPVADFFRFVLFDADAVRSSVAWPLLPLITEIPWAGPEDCDGGRFVEVVADTELRLFVAVRLESRFGVVDDMSRDECRREYSSIWFPSKLLLLLLLPFIVLNWIFGFMQIKMKKKTFFFFSNSKNLDTKGTDLQ